MADPRDVELVRDRFERCLEALEREPDPSPVARSIVLFLLKYIEERILVPLAPPGEPPPITSGFDLGSYRREKHASVEGCYAAWAAVYGLKEAKLFADEERVLGPLLGDLAGKAVLDLGCGSGRHALRFARQGARVTGIDRTPEMIEQARRNAAREGLDVGFLLGDALEIDPGGPFDLVFSALAVTHFPDLGALLGRLAAWLAPGGRIVVSDVHPELKDLGAGVGFIEGETRTYHEIEHHTHRVSDWFAAARRAGLVVEDVVEDPGKGLPFLLVVQLGTRRRGRSRTIP